MKPILIAACGMNCALCIAYLRDKNNCPGCRLQGQLNSSNAKYCRKCIIKNCQFLKKSKQKYCSRQCPDFPCQRLKNLDKRYRTKYGMSMIKNLGFIEKNGIRSFLRKEKEKWKKGQEVFCVHKKEYYKAR